VNDEGAEGAAGVDEEDPPVDDPVEGDVGDEPPQANAARHSPTKRALTVNGEGPDTDRVIGAGGPGL